MDLQRLETKVARRPHSPLFARLASEYLAIGRIEDAGELCRAGLQQFPMYATAHIIQAKYFAVQQDYISALVHLQNALNVVPHSTFLQKLYVEWKEMAIQQTTLRHHIPPIVQEEIQLSEETFDVPRGTSESNRTVSATFDVEQESEHVVSEIVAEQRSPSAEPISAMTQASPLVRHDEKTWTQPSGFSPQQLSEEGRIVSKTLAEIYATQGEYGEAILTYQLLKRQRPAQQQEFEQRIKELEGKLQTKAMQ